MVLAIRFVAPLANGSGSGGGQERVSAEGANRDDGTVGGNQDFQDNVTGASRGR